MMTDTRQRLAANVAAPRSVYRLQRDSDQAQFSLHQDYAPMEPANERTSHQGRAIVE